MQKFTMPIKDLVGQKFGHLTVLERLNIPGNSRWLCRCDCGNLHEAYATNLKSGRVASCGCVKRRGKNPADNVEGTSLSAITRKKRSDKTFGSGVKGVTWDNTHKKWVAKIGFKGKVILLGYFDELRPAVEVRKKAEELYFKPILEKYSDNSDKPLCHPTGSRGKED
jgi:hypothetical protein